MPALPWQRGALVLASASAARRRLLEAAGLSFRIAPADLDEAEFREAWRGAPDALALALAERKAEAVAARPDEHVIGADQLLVYDGTIFGKARSDAEARDLLRRLRGTAHTLPTAVVLRRGGRTVWRHVATPRLVMRPFSDAFLDAYCAAEGGALLAGVGAYRLEALGQHLFERVEGETSAILGLPMLALLEALRGEGVLIA